MRKQIISSEEAPAAIGPYSHAVQANGFLFVSGQLGIDPVTGNMPDSFEAQAHFCLQNLQTILEKAEISKDYVVKTTVFLTQMEYLSELNSIYGEYFGHDFPSRSAIEVSNLPKDALIEIECIAAEREMKEKGRR
jgi:2-iminobutanoate/2-iminopropanoate deaminase